MARRVSQYKRTQPHPSPTHVHLRASVTEQRAKVARDSIAGLGSVARHPRAQVKLSADLPPNILEDLSTLSAHRSERHSRSLWQGPWGVDVSPTSQPVLRLQHHLRCGCANLLIGMSYGLPALRLSQGPRQPSSWPLPTQISRGRNSRPLARLCLEECAILPVDLQGFRAHFSVARTTSLQPPAHTASQPANVHPSFP